MMASRPRIWMGPSYSNGISNRASSAHRLPRSAPLKSFVKNRWRASSFCSRIASVMELSLPASSTWSTISQADIVYEPPVRRKVNMSRDAGIRVGLFLDARGETIAPRREAWKIADDAGFDHLWHDDHLLTLAGGRPP